MPTLPEAVTKGIGVKEISSSLFLLHTLLEAVTKGIGVKEISSSSLFLLPTLPEAVTKWYWSKGDIIFIFVPSFNTPKGSDKMVLE